MKFIRDLLTEKDNNTYDVVRVLGVIGFFVYLFLAIEELFRHCRDFSLTDMATGISILLAVIAGGVTFKYRSERAITEKLEK